MKKYIICSLFITCFTILSAQTSIGSTTQINKWRVGGSIGLGFGNNSYFGLSVAPFAGYAITPELEGGLAAGYQYNKDDYYSSNIFSIGPYVNYYFIQNFFARANYEYLTGTREWKYNNHSYDIDESALWLGAGYQSTGPIRYQVGIMYNVLYDEDESIYNNGLKPFAGIAVSL